MGDINKSCQRKSLYKGFFNTNMDQLTLGLAILATLVVILVGLLFLKSQSPTEEKKSKRRVAAIPNRDQDGQIIQAGPGPRGRRGGGPRMRRRVEEEPEPEPEIVPDHSDVSDEETSEKSKIPAKMGKKKMEKMQAKADRKVQLEAEMREREERKKRLEQEEEERKKQVEQEQELERQKEKREYEEYLKMKEAFSVEEEGFDENPEDDKENKLEVFIQYIKDTKVVVLE